MPNRKSHFLIKRKQRLSFEGDSLTCRRMAPAHDTWPYLRMMHWDKTWADFFSETLFCGHPELQLEFRNSAVGGSNIVNVLQRFDACVAPFQPDWLFITIGNNDPHQNIALDVFQAGVIELAQRVRKLSRGRVVFLGGTHPKSHKSRPLYCKALQYAAKQEGGIYVDFQKVLLKKWADLQKSYAGHTIYSDGNHFNEVGATIVAQVALKAIGFEF